MEDQRAHERITSLESVVNNHMVEHSRFEKSLEDNTKLTQEIADNTSELVMLFRGAKGMSAFIRWIWPFMLVIAAVLISAIGYFKGRWG